MSANSEEKSLSESVVEATRAPVRPVSFEEARDQYQSLVFAFVSRRIRQVEEAQDLTAQVFIDAFRQWKGLRGPAKLYLLGIARKKVSDALRRRRRTLTLREGDWQASGMDEFVSFAEANEAYAVVMRLPADERDAILMQVLEELPVEEIAPVIGRSVKATHSLLQRARSRISKMTAAQSSNGGSK
jgi:RNA polymerase sigma-70 factor, ECF subfamily